MQIIIDFLTGIADSITALLRYLVEIVAGFVYVLKMLLYFTVNIPRYFLWLPAEYVTLIVLVFSVAVMYKVFGKGN